MFLGPNLLLRECFIPYFFSKFLRFVPCSEPVEAGQEGKHIVFKWEKGDKSMISVDMSSLNPETVGAECMTLYKYLVLIEKQKMVTSYELSYSEVKRATSGGGDSFEVTIKNGHSFKTLADSSKPLSCKAFFHDAFLQVDKSQLIQAVFRFRFDRVHACTKVQRPYVYTCSPMELDALKPVELA